jgi:P-type Cu+ transporter
MIQTDQIRLTGMTCAACAARIEKGLLSLPGILTANVNFATEEASIKRDDSNLTDAAIIERIEAIGYGGSFKSNDQLPQFDQALLLKKRFYQSLILSLPVIILAMGAHAIDAFHGSWSLIIQAISTTIILVWPGRIFFERSWKSLKHRSTDMNTLIALGSSAAYLGSLITLATAHHHPHVYFEVAASIITLILLGNWLQTRALDEARRSMADLLALTPETVRIKSGDQEKLIAIGEAKKGDLLVIKPGERIPLDGILRSGAADIDESLLSGESAPVSRTVGSNLLGGSMNLNGYLLLEVQSVQHQGFLQKVIELVQNSQGSKVPIQQLADRIAGRFVPIVLMLAIATFIGWMLFAPPEIRLELGFQSMIAVLIIACPCALGLATPAAILVGTSAAAKAGIILRSGAAVQKAAEINTILFDKTGTLTEGKFSIASVDLQAGIDESKFWRWVGSAESASEHPLAKVIVAETIHHGIPIIAPTSFEAISGGGIRATVDQHHLILGHHQFLLENGIHGSDDTSESTTILVGIDGTFAGKIRCEDKPRPEVPTVVRELTSIGFELHLISGDRTPVVENFARTIGIAHWKAEVRPQEKWEILKHLQQQGKRVAMVGDGINDAPALAQADLAIAIGTGTQVAIEAADVVLVQGRIERLVPLFDISKRTMRTIRQNLGFAFGYNLIAIPIAMGLLYPFTGWLLNPMIASATMAFSSLSVVLNALRLSNSAKS